MERLKVALGARSYDILIENGLLERAGEWLGPLARGNRLIVVSDETVWAAQGERLRRGLGSLDAIPLLVPPGEGSKSFATLARLIEHMRRDKKKEGGRLPFILVRGIGQAFLDRSVALEDVAAFLDRAA